MAGSIPEEFISDLIARADIVGLIERHIPLQKSGREFKACCPFHDEKTPSFFINPTKQFYHCFGCGKSGNVVSFLMEYSNLQFRDAIEELASFVGVDVPVSSGGSHGGGDFNLMLRLMSEVQIAYRDELMSGKNAKAARAYLKSRNITAAAAEQFGLGFAPESWNFILTRFGKSESGRKLLLKTGMTASNDSGKMYDRFRNRLMFPIMDRRNRVIAFGGRVIDSGEPKYLNSPETPLFSKGSEAFGLNHALSAARAAGKILVVEGYTDVLALSQYGIQYSVATLGTATTGMHIRKLFQAASHIVFCFDGDSAGRTAAWRALESVLPMMHDGNLASFMFLPQGHDPDSLIREEGASGFEERIASAVPISEFVFDVLTSRTDTRRLDGQAKLVEEFKTIFEKLPQSTLRALMMKKLGDLTDLDVGYLDSIYSPNKKSTAVRQRSIPKGPIAIGLSKKAVAVLIQNPGLAQLINRPEEFHESEDIGDNLLGTIALMLELEPELATAALVEKFRDTDKYDVVCKLVGFDHRISDENLETEFQGIISKMQSRLVEKKLNQRISQLDSGSEQDMQRVKQLVNDHLASKGIR